MAPVLRSLALAFASLLVADAASAAPQSPAPDPPAAYGGAGIAAFGGPEHWEPSPAGQVEWTLHRSADGAHPDDREQKSLWLMNRARQDPTAEGVFLATIDDGNVQSALGYFDVDLGLLQAEFAAIAPKPPAAFDARLWEAAWQHSLYLIANDAQNHNDQFTRVSQAGFHASGMRGNVFSYSESALYGHAGFNVDWGGNDGTGMQTGRGHRKAIMSTDGNYTNVGLAVVPEWSAATSVGPLVTTGNYAQASTSWPDHHNRFVVGTVWHDQNGNDRYDEGEGMAGVTVEPDVGSYFAVTSAGGGYAIPILAAGTYQLTFTAEGLGSRVESVAIGTSSVLVDADPATFTAVPEPHGLLAAAAACLALAARRRLTIH
jgi:hypothetical protein